MVLIRNELDYAKYESLPELPYNILSELMKNPDAEILWKLLYYTDNDAYSKDNLTVAQKRNLIYGGQADASKYSVFFDSGMDDSITEQKFYLRIYPYSCSPLDAYNGIIDIAFETMCHYSINTLSNYQTRVDMANATILKCLNGVGIKGIIGQMYFDQSRARTNKFQNFNQPPLKSKILIMSANVK